VLRKLVHKQKRNNIKEKEKYMKHYKSTEHTHTKKKTIIKQIFKITKLVIRTQQRAKDTKQITIIQHTTE
jgi:hypothetical protein